MKRPVIIIAVVAVIVAIGLLGWLGYGHFFGGASSKAKFEAALLRESPIYQTIKAKFPKDYEALVAELFALIEAKKPRQELFASAAAATAKIRKKYSGRIASAPDEDLKRIVRVSRDLHSVVLEKEGYETCNKLGTSGVAGIPGLSTKYGDIITQQGVAYFEAVARAIENPAKREPPSVNDWSILTKTMVKNGSSENDIAALGNQKSDDPRYCATLIVFMNTLESLPGDAGIRLRADFVKSVSGS